MHLDLKEDALVDQVKVYNANKANGYLTSAKAQLVYTDGTKRRRSCHFRYAIYI